MQQKNCSPSRKILIAVLVLPLLIGFSACKQDRNERISGIYALKAEPTAENQQKIRDLLDDQNRDVRATAVNALVSIGVDDAADLARTALADDDGFVRATAAKLLGDLGDPADADRLAVRLREDADPIVRRRAAEALNRIGGETAVAGLAVALSDPMEDVRLAATRGLRELDPGYAKPELGRLLLEDPNYEIRVQSARALGATGDPEMLPLLEAALQDPNEFVRAAAANALRTHKAVREGVDVESDRPGAASP
jgi:HEAT repeat protein